MDGLFIIKARVFLKFRKTSLKFICMENSISSVTVTVCHPSGSMRKVKTKPVPEIMLGMWTLKRGLENSTSTLSQYIEYHCEIRGIIRIEWEPVSHDKAGAAVKRAVHGLEK